MTDVTMTARQAARSVVAVLVLATLAGCQGGADGAAPGLPAASSSGVLTTSPVAGERLCGFVPRESAEDALGSTAVAGKGAVRRASSGELSSAECLLAPAGLRDPSAIVHVEALRGTARDIFDRELRNPERNQLPASVGLGYSWTDPVGYRATANGPVAETWLLHGNHLVQVSVWSPPEGRDGERDATALAQQVVRTLDLRDTWTLAEKQPVR